MPKYEVSLPNGKTYEVESPTELTDAQAYAAVQSQIASGSAQETGRGGILPSLAEGFATSFTSIPLGIASIFSEAPEETAAGKFSLEAEKRVQDILGIDPTKEATTAEAVAGGLGSLASFLVPGTLAAKGVRAAGAGAQAARGAGYVAAGAQAVPLGAGEQVQRRMAEEAATGIGVSEEDRLASQRLGGAIGLSELVPLRKFLGPLEAILARVPIAKAGGVGEIVETSVKRALRSATEEGAQEALAQGAQNLVEQGYYNPDLDITEGLLGSAGVGGAAGGTLDVILQLMAGRKASKMRTAFTQLEREDARQAAEKAPERIRADALAGREELLRNAPSGEIKITSADNTETGFKYKVVDASGKAAATFNTKDAAFLAAEQYERDNPGAVTFVRPTIAETARTTKGKPTKQEKKQGKKIAQQLKAEGALQPAPAQLPTTPAGQATTGAAIAETVQQVGATPTQAAEIVAPAAPKKGRKKRIAPVEAPVPEGIAAPPPVSTTAAGIPAPPTAAPAAMEFGTADERAAIRREIAPQAETFRDMTPEQQAAYNAELDRRYPGRSYSVFPTPTAPQATPTAAPVSPTEAPPAAVQPTPAAKPPREFKPSVRALFKPVVTSPDGMRKLQEFEAKRDEVAKALNTRLAPIVGKGVRIQLDDVVRQGKGIAEGAVSPAGDVIYLSYNLYDPNLTVDQMVDKLFDVMNHEVIHSLSNLGLFRGGELPTLFKAAERIKYQGNQFTYYDRAERMYRGVKGYQNADGSLNEEMIHEEAVAEMFRDARSGKLKLEGTPKGVFGRIVEFFKRLFNGYRDAKVGQIFKDIEAGKMGAREARAVEGGVRKLSAVPQDRDSAFEELADAQRGLPETAMLKAQAAVAKYPSGPTFGYKLEHVGDITHRMAEKPDFFTDRNQGLVKKKVDIGLSLFDYPVDVERINAIPDLPEIKAYANEHAKLPVYNEAQRAARDAAVAFGRRNWAAAESNLRTLKDMIDNGSYVEIASSFDPQFEGGVRKFSVIPEADAILPREIAPVSTVNLLWKAVGPPLHLRFKGGYRGLVEAGQYISSIYESLRDDAGQPVDLSRLSPSDRKKIEDTLVAEGLYALNDSTSAIGWYDRKLKHAYAIMSLIRPEIVQNPDAKSAFDFALAVTSNGMAVEENFREALRQYDYYRANGRFEEVGVGKQGGAMAQSFRFFNVYSDLYGIESLTKFLNTKFTVKELRDMGLTKGTSELPDTEVYGSFILGPKIGQGFYQNIRGNYDTLTMDRWFMRMWNRITGKPFAEPPKPEVLRANRLFILNAAKATKAPKIGKGKKPDAKQQILINDVSVLEDASTRFFGDKNYKKHLAKIKLGTDEGVNTMDEFVVLLERRFQSFWTRYKNQTGKNPEKSDMFKRVGSHSTAVVGELQEDPRSATERKNIREVVANVVDRLSGMGNNITTADFQALLWYPEKRLWKERLGVKPGQGEDNDYADAARIVALENGVPLNAIENATRSVDRAIAAGRSVTPTTGAVGGQAARSDLTESQRRSFILDEVGRKLRRLSGPRPDGENGLFRRVGSRSTRDAVKGERHPVTGNRTIAVYSAGGRAGWLKTLGITVQKMYELDPKTDADNFRNAVINSVAGSPYAPAVTIKTIEELTAPDTRLFLSEDGTYGFALSGNDIVSVFSDPSSGNKNTAVSMIELAKQQGGRRLDCYDTILPQIYGRAGFKFVARLPFDDSQALPSWFDENGDPKPQFRQFTSRTISGPAAVGRPDLVFGAFTNAEIYNPSDAKPIDSYDVGLRMQEDAVNQYEDLSKKQAAKDGPVSAEIQIAEDIADAVADKGEASQAEVDVANQAVKDAVRKLSTIPQPVPMPPEMEDANRRIFAATHVPSTPGEKIMGVLGGLSSREGIGRLADMFRVYYVQKTGQITKMERQAYLSGALNPDEAEFAEYSATGAADMMQRSSHYTVEAAYHGAPVIRGLNAKREAVSLRAGGDPNSAYMFIEKDQADSPLKVLEKIITGGPNGGDLTEQFRSYAIAQVSKRRLEEGKDIPEDITPEYIEAADALAEQYPIIKEAFESYQRFNTKLLEAVRDSGFLSQELFEEFTDQQNYYSMYRQLEEGDVVQELSGGLASRIRFKAYEGSTTGNLMADPIVAMMHNVAFWNNVILRTLATQKAFRVGEATGVVKRLRAFEDEDGNVTIETPSRADGFDDKTFYTYINGVEVPFASRDPLFTIGLSGNDFASPGLFLELAGMPADFLREMVTRDPGFMVANLMRDSVSTWVLAGSGANPFQTFKGFISALNSSSSFEALRSYGVVGSFDEAQKPLAKIVSGMRQRLTKVQGLPSMTSALSGAWNKLGSWSEASDAATRIAVYEAAKRDGASDFTAAYRALSIMNFSRSGHSAGLRMWTRMVPFLNARIQGFDVLYTGLKSAAGVVAGREQLSFERQRGTHVLVRGMALTAAAMALSLLLEDDEDYQELPPYIKDANILIPIPGEKGKYFQIPKPFEAGFLFMTVPQTFYDVAMGNRSMRSATKLMFNQFSSTFGFNPIPQAALPIVENMINRDFYTGQPLVSAGMQQLDPSLQYNASTSYVARGLSQLSSFLPLNYNFEEGRFVPISPIMLDNLISGYGGPLISYIGMGIGGAAYMFGSDNQGLPVAGSQLPVIRRFFVDARDRQPQAATEAYELYQLVDKTNRTISRLKKMGDTEALKEYREENINILRVGKQVRQMADNLNNIRAQIRRLEADKVTPMSEKLDKLRELRSRELRVTRRIDEINQKLGR